MDQDVARSRAAGFSAHLIKPIDVQALDKAIEGALRDEDTKP
jgi:CheY-like chemotaxis protein